ncbi:hypothetical protein AB0B88_16340 [Micromonospora haikouensis]|uniref:hypothetical protein n=1 Tax=Actinomycetes TaxID=1760 RepID=UPI00340474BD
MTTHPRRPTFDPPYNELYDWLAANGIDEWLPESPTFVINPAAGTLTYTGHAWTGPRGWDPQHMASSPGGDVIERRTVPLLAPPTDRIRELCAATGAHLEEPGR